MRSGSLQERTDRQSALTVRKARGSKLRQIINKPMAKHKCALCHLSKVEDAFPRAQIQSETQHCLACLKSQKELWCSVCSTRKQQSEFIPTVITLPQGRCCIICQEAGAQEADSCRKSERLVHVQRL